MHRSGKSLKRQFSARQARKSWFFGDVANLVRAGNACTCKNRQCNFQKTSFRDTPQKVGIWDFQHVLLKITILRFHELVAKSDLSPKSEIRSGPIGNRQFRSGRSGIANPDRARARELPFPIGNRQFRSGIPIPIGPKQFARLENLNFAAHIPTRNEMPQSGFWGCGWHCSQFDGQWCMNL